MRATAPTLRSAEDLRRTTAPALLVERARREPERVAFRAKKLGIYGERTWAQYALMVARTAKAFDTLGLKPGERIVTEGSFFVRAEAARSRPGS